MECKPECVPKNARNILKHSLERKRTGVGSTALSRLHSQGLYKSPEAGHQQSEDRLEVELEVGLGGVRGKAQGCILQDMVRERALRGWSIFQRWESNEELAGFQSSGWSLYSGATLRPDCRARRPATCPALQIKRFIYAVSPGPRSLLPYQPLKKRTD